jgi:hypothetical protein
MSLSISNITSYESCKSSQNGAQSPLVFTISPIETAKKCAKESSVFSREMGTAANSLVSSQNDTFLLQLLKTQPVGEDIENIVDKHFWSIHGSENSLQQVQELFLKFIQANSAIPCSFQKTLPEKAEDIFNAYREAYFSTLRQNQAFQDIIEKQKKAISIFFPASKIEDAIQYIVLARVKAWHSTVPGLALEKALSLPQYSLKLHEFSHHFLPIQMENSIFLTFYETVLAKFELHG